MYIVIETCKSCNTDNKPPYSRVQGYADGTVIKHKTSKEAAEYALRTLKQPNNGVVNTCVQFIKG